MPERTIDTPLGPLLARSHDGALVALRFDAAETRSDECPVLDKAESQLHAYFNKGLDRFDLPLAPEGTAFQREVWDALLTIPRGETRSYASIARQIGNPDAIRGDHPLPPRDRVRWDSARLRGRSGAQAIPAGP